jgi:hypothetical protein
MLILSGLIANPGESLSNSEVRVPRTEKFDGAGVEGDVELLDAEKERFVTFARDILHLVSRLHIGRRTVRILKGMGICPLPSSSR